MKKVLLFTTLAVFGFTSLNAQEIKLGIKGGLKFAQIKGENSQKNNRITDFNLGIMAEIPIANRFTFQPELLYSGQGSSVNLNYLNIPLVVKYNLTKEFSLEAGPQIGFLLSANANGNNVKSSFKTLDFSLNFGLSYQLNNKIYFGARYNLGLTNISTGVTTQYISSKIKNEVFQLTIGYFLF